ncbi:DeoR/GlpR transcriptional regulator [Micrococcales bacterium 31B]|nr:DeoR/GlpR transcriptional regulator [Micrococcales bacterium 31B]
MYAEERQAAIAALINESGRVSVAKIAESFSVTPETVRRDLDVLEHAGIVRRVHGGALPAGALSHLEAGVAEREGLHADGKERIARAALAYLPAPGGSLAIDGGTTTGRLTHLIHHETYTVVTNSIPALGRLASSHTLTLHVVGGRVRPETSAIVGGQAITEIEALRFDVAFMGTNGISASHGLSTPDLDEAAIKRALMASATTRIALADSSKFGSEFLHRFGRLADLDVIITDAEPPGDIRAELQQLDIEVVIA